MGVGFSILPPPTPGSRPRRPQALRSPPRLLPKLGSQSRGRWRLPAPQTRREGGRALGGWAGEGGRGRAGRPAESAWCRLGPRARRGHVPAEPAAAGRGRLGHALFIAEPPAARAAAASLAFPARAAGCAEERERGAFTILWQLRE